MKAYDDLEQREIKTYEAWKSKTDQPVCDCGYHMILIPKQNGYTCVCADPRCLLPTKFIKG